MIHETIHTLLTCEACGGQMGYDDECKVYVCPGCGHAQGRR